MGWVCTSMFVPAAAVRSSIGSSSTVAGSILVSAPSRSSPWPKPVRRFWSITASSVRASTRCFIAVRKGERRPSLSSLRRSSRRGSRRGAVLRPNQVGEGASSSMCFPLWATPLSTASRSRTSLALSSLTGRGVAPPGTSCVSGSMSCSGAPWSSSTALTIRRTSSWTSSPLCAGTLTIAPAFLTRRCGQHSRRSGHRRRPTFSRTFSSSLS